MPGRTRPAPLQRRQFGRRLPHPPQRVHPFAALLPAQNAPPAGDLRRQTAGKRTFPLHLVGNGRLGRRGSGRLDRGRDPARSGRRSGSRTRHGKAPEPCGVVRRPGRRHDRRRLRPRRPETREHHRRPGPENCIRSTSTPHFCPPSPERRAPNWARQPTSIRRARRRISTNGSTTTPQP